MRLWTATTQPWYWDEGYVAEAAVELSQCHRPRVSALWQDGFFPLSTSFLAPLSAAPFTLIPGILPLTGVRLWAMLLSLAAACTLALLARRLAGPGAGLLAAAIMCLHPFAVEFGARAFYHHAAVLFLLLAALWSLDETRWRSSALASGVALLSCYWLWWSPAVLAMFRKRLIPYLSLAALPLLFLAANFWPDPSGSLWSAKALLLASKAQSPSVPQFFGALSRFTYSIPFLPLGLACLAWVSWRVKEARLPLILGVLAFLEPLRQRGDIRAMPYPMLPALPFAYLGFALLPSAVKSHTWRLCASAGALIILLLPLNFSSLRSWSVEQQRTIEFADFMKSTAKPDDLIMGLPNYNWLLKPLHAVEPFDIGASEGRESGFYPAGIPASRLALPCPLASIHYVTSCRVHTLGLTSFPGAAQTFRQIDAESWPQIWDNKSFRVFENPRFRKPRQ